MLSGRLTVCRRYDGMPDAGSSSRRRARSPARMDATLKRGRPSGGRRFLTLGGGPERGMRPPDSAGHSQGPRRSSVASQTRRSSHHHVSQAPGQRVDLACVRVDRAHRVHGHCAFDAPVGIGYCAHSAPTPVIARPLARHEICSDRTIPTTPIAASGTGGLLPSPRSSKSPLSIPSQRGDDLCGQSLGEGGSVVTFVVDRALEPAHAV